MKEELPEQPDENPVADAMLEVAQQEERQRAASHEIANAYRQFQAGEITGADYAEISHPRSFIENTSRDTAQTAKDRINNEGQSPQLSSVRRFARSILRKII